jgi:tetratricopeptide (TPR) repeat protein
MNMRFIVSSILCINFIFSIAMPTTAGTQKIVTTPQQALIQKPQALTPTEQIEYDKLSRQLFEHLDANGLYNTTLDKTLEATIIYLKKIGTSVAMRLLDNQTKLINYIFDGSQLLTAKKYTEAINVFNTAIAIDPNNALCLLSRGSLYEALLDFNQAINDFTKAISLSAWIPTCLRNKTLGACYFNRALAYYSLENSNAANSDMEAAASLGHSVAPTLLKLWKEINIEICKGGVLQ